MSTNGDDDRRSAYASPPCFAAEAAPDYFDPLAVDPEQARDVGRWRRAERARLRSVRLALDAETRAAAAAGITTHLRALLAAAFPHIRGRTISAYWPIKGEPDLRPFMAELHAAGAVVALPIVETRHAPLVFRVWTPTCPMTRTAWDILAPTPDAPVATPQILLAPLVGWDPAGFRLGYGGGYFDRTLAASKTREAVIGVGFEAARLPTIYPQPHDVRLDYVVTEAGVRFGERAAARRPASL